mmetsp:Transcript_29282/g.33629  ORF Transcript_29282/g.33629 Transcript_29282/m.33629 type:complete len:659 (+) Transcript_29282:2-1978(+)
MRSCDDKDANWFPSHLFKDCIFGIIGGGAQHCCAFVGNVKPRLASNVTVERKIIQKELNHIVEQGEGERMVFSVMHRLIKLCFHIKPSCKMDAIFVIHSDDSDVTGGMAMFFVHSLHSTQQKYKMKQSHRFTGSIIVRGRNKAVGAIMRLNKSLISHLGIDTNLQSTISGKGWIFQLDIIALYYRLEDCLKLSHLPPGHKAVSVTSANYCFSNNDYLASYGESCYENFINVLTSDDYKRCVSKYNPEDCSPMILTPVIFDDDSSDNTLQQSSLNLCGIIIVFLLNMSRRTHTSAQLRRYFPDKAQMFDQFFQGEKMSDTYGIVRAAAILAGEEHQLPDPIALLSRIACANRVFQQMTVNVYQNVVTPQVGHGELDNTPYIIPNDAELTNTSCSIDYGISSLQTTKLKLYVKKYGFDENVQVQFKNNLYGSIIDIQQLEGKKPWMFDVADVIINTIMNNGITPTDRIKGADIIPQLQAVSFDDFKEKIQKYNAVDNGQFNGLNILKEIITLAISSRTEYRKKGEGRPQLLNSKVIDVSRGWKSETRAWDEIEIIDARYAGWLTQKMKDIYTKLGTDSHHDAMEFISFLVAHIFRNAVTNNPIEEINVSANDDAGNGRQVDDLDLSDDGDSYDGYNGDNGNEDNEDNEDNDDDDLNEYIV